MNKLTERQWCDVAPRLTNRACTACSKHYISHEPRYVEIGGVYMLITTCNYCGHIEMYDVAELARFADMIDREVRKGG